MKYALLPSQKELCKRVVSAHREHQLEAFLVMEDHGLIAFIDNGRGRDPPIETSRFELKALEKLNLIQLSVDDRGALQMGSITQELIDAVDADFDLPETRAMPKYNLLPEQEEICRQLADLYRNHNARRFEKTTEPLGPIFEFRNAERDQVGKLKIENDDLREIARVGLISLKIDPVHAHKITGGALRKELLDAIDNDFQVPTSVPTVGQIQYFFAPIGAYQQVNGSRNIAIQNAGVQPKELLELFSLIRTNIETDIASEHRVEANEYLNDLQHEVAQELPKQSRIKSTIRSLWSFAKEGSALGANLVKIAQAFGIQLG